jgi:hypothetical protein
MLILTVETVFNGPTAYRKPFFGGQLTIATMIQILGTCIRRILPETERIPVPCRSFSGRFRCVYAAVFD